MPDVMEPDRWEAGSAHCLGEPLREPLRMDRDTVLSNEQKAGLLPNRARRHSLFELTSVESRQVVYEGVS